MGPRVCLAEARRTRKLIDMILFIPVGAGVVLFSNFPAVDCAVVFGMFW